LGAGAARSAAILTASIGDIRAAVAKVDREAHDGTVEWCLVDGRPVPC
jgi:hypothetical protein